MTEWAHGGPLFWVIVACGVAGLAIFVERAFHLHRARIRTEDFLRGIFTILRRGNNTEAVTICEETPGPVAFIVKTAVRHRGDQREDLRAAVDQAGRVEIARMERRVRLLATIGQIAPLLGLLGTVLAMLHGLYVMSQQAPLVQAEDIAYWLRQALLATAAGLSVAIPCHAGYSFLLSRVERLIGDMERAAAEVLAFLASPDESHR